MGASEGMPVLMTAFLGANCPMLLPNGRQIVANCRKTAPPFMPTQVLHGRTGVRRYITEW